MDSENPLSYYQEYDKWYQSRFDPSEWPESLVNSTLCSYNRTLMVIVHQPLYPITESVLNQVFDSFGVVEDISIVSASKNVQALLRFEQYSSCFSALSSLHGRYIYDNCCKLEIHHLSKNFVDRVVRQNPLGEGIDTESFINLRQMKLFLDYMDKSMPKSESKTSESDCVVNVFEESPVKETKEEVKVFDESPEKEIAEALVLKAVTVKSNGKLTESGVALHGGFHMMDEMLVKELKLCDEKVTETVAYKVFEEPPETVRRNEEDNDELTSHLFDPRRDICDCKLQSCMRSSSHMGVNKLHGTHVKEGSKAEPTYIGWKILTEFHAFRDVLPLVCDGIDGGSEDPVGRVPVVVVAAGQQVPSQTGEAVVGSDWCWCLDCSGCKVCGRWWLGTAAAGECWGRCSGQCCKGCGEHEDINSSLYRRSKDVYISLLFDPGRSSCKFMRKEWLA